MKLINETGGCVPLKDVEPGLFERDGRLYLLTDKEKEKIIKKKLSFTISKVPWLRVFDVALGTKTEMRGNLTVIPLVWK